MFYSIGFGSSCKILFDLAIYEISHVQHVDDYIPLMTRLSNFVECMRMY